jgi:hypothetical protein
MNLLIRHSLILLIYLVAQLLVFNHFTLWEMASAHAFLVALLVLPVNTPFPLLILIGFVMGMLVDVFSVGAFKGVSAFAAVFMLGLRNPWVSVITNRSSYRGSEETLIRVQPMSWQVQYLAPLILSYELAYHLIEAFSFAHLGLTMLKVGASLLFSFTICLVLTLWIHQDAKR